MKFPTSQVEGISSKPLLRLGVKVTMHKAVLLLLSASLLNDFTIQVTHGQTRDEIISVNLSYLAVVEVAIKR